MFLLIVFMTIGCLRSELISFQQIDSLRKKAILQSYNERFHVSNITFACNQTNNANTMDMLRKVLKKEKVRFKGKYLDKKIISRNFTSAIRKLLKKVFETKTH